MGKDKSTLLLLLVGGGVALYLVNEMNKQRQTAIQTQLSNMNRPKSDFDNVLAAVSAAPSFIGGIVDIFRPKETTATTTK